MFQLLISPLVYEDINEIREYISEELYNLQAADELINQITNKIRNLIEFPYSGSPLNIEMDVATDYRFLLCNNYLIFYRVEEMNIKVSRVLYNRRNYINILFDN